MSFNWAQLAVGETRSGCSNQGFQEQRSPSPLPLGTTLDCIAEISGALCVGGVAVRAVHETLAGFGLWSGVLSIPRANSTNPDQPRQTLLKGSWTTPDLLLQNHTSSQGSSQERCVPSKCLEHRQQKSHFDTTQEVYGIKSKQQNESNVPPNAPSHLHSKTRALRLWLRHKRIVYSPVKTCLFPIPHRRYPGYPNDSLTCCLHLLQQHQPLGIPMRLDFGQFAQSPNSLYLF